MRFINNYSFLFNNSKSNNLINSMNYSDMALIRNGAYSKLVKAQYSKNKVNNKTDNSINDKINTMGTNGLIDTKVKSSVESLQSKVSDLSIKDIWDKKDGEYDIDKITKSIKDFISSYNDVISSVDASNNTSVKQSARWMKSLTNTMNTSLKRVGINLDSDNKLSVDDEKIKTADIKELKALFSGDFSYANQIADKAKNVQSTMLKYYNTYTNLGTYFNMSGSWFNTKI